MSTFADAYSRYLTNHFHYIKKYKTFRKYFKNSIVSLTDPKYMSKTLISAMDDFPKYPYFMNVFARTDSINLVKIYNSSMDNIDSLMESMVGSSTLEKKELYDSIPSSLDQFLAEVNFQFAYVSTPNNLYHYDQIVKSFVAEYQYRNFFSDLYVDLFHSTDQIDGETAGLEEKSFQYQYMLYSCLYNVVTISHNLHSKLILYLTYINNDGADSDRVNQTSVLSDFQLFITNYGHSMCIDLAGIVSKSMYNFQKISDKMMGDLYTVIDAKINHISAGLYRSFYDFYHPLTSLEPVNIISNNVTQHLNALVAADVVSKIFDDSNIIDQNSTSLETLNEEDAYTSYMGKISESSLKNYLFLCFLYKFWPIKFLNILQLSIKEYTEAEIKNTGDDLKTQIEYGDFFRYLCNNYINYSNLKTYLDNMLIPVANIITYGAGTNAKFTFTPGTTAVLCSNLDSYNAVNIHEYIYAEGDTREFSAHVINKDFGTRTLIIDNEYQGTISTANVNAYRYTFSPTNYLYGVSVLYQVPEFACLNYYIYILEEYFKSTAYDTFVQELAELVFIYLRDNGHVDYDFDWYEFHNVIDVYLKVYLRWKLTDQSRRCTLSNFKNSKYKFTNGSTIVYCGNKESWTLPSVGDYIFSELDTIDSAAQIFSKSTLGSSYVLNLTLPYSGQSTLDTDYSVAYTFTSTAVTLFNNTTQNFSNKLYPRVITNNITHDPTYDINMIIPEVTDLEDYFETFSKSQAFARSMHQFSENLILSTLTRETIYSVLSEFV